MSANIMYDIVFFGDDVPSLPITYEEYQVVSEGLESSRFIEIQGQNINTTSIKAIIHHVDPVMEPWQSPVDPSYKVDETQLKKFKQLKDKLFKKKANTVKEPYNPLTDLPKDWRKFLENKGFDLENPISLYDQEAINAGRARVDDDGYIVYDYDREMAHERNQKGHRYYVQDVLDVMVEEATV